MNTIEKIAQCLEDIGIILNPYEDGNENIFDYGVDSLGYIYLICTIEEVFDIEIPDEYLARNDVVTLKMLESIVTKAFANSDVSI